MSHKKILIIFFIIIVAFYFQTKNKNKMVNIVLTADSNYTDCLRVAIKSAVLNKSKDNIYNFFIITIDLSDENIKEIKKLERDDAKINIIPLTVDLVKKIAPDESHYRITRGDLFKYIYPEILKDIDKVLALDCDIIILKDLLNLYNTNISDKYLGAVIKRRKNNKNTKEKIIGPFFYHKKYYTYNAGVMLLNLKKMREDKISEKLISMQQYDTQKTYNDVIPDYEIRKISLIYNFDPTFYLQGNLNFSDIKEMFYPFLWRYKSLDNFFDDVAIIHWAGGGKPWNDKDILFRDIWLNYAIMIDNNQLLKKVGL